MLMRFDPYRDFDRLTEQLASTASRAPRALPMDAYRRGEQFVVELDLPGVEPASIDLTVEQNVLTVRAERRFEPQHDDEVVVAERPHGTYTRQILLGDTLDSENMQANCEHGVLRLTIPVAETAKPRRVQISASKDAQTIEPQTSGGTQASSTQAQGGQEAPPTGTA
jgi:HSP20 family protein